RDGDRLGVVGPDGTSRPAPSPLADAAFVAHLGAFRRLVRTPVAADADRADLAAAATAVGRALFGVLFAAAEVERLGRARTTAARPACPWRSWPPGCGASCAAGRRRSSTWRAATATTWARTRRRRRRCCTARAWPRWSATAARSWTSCRPGPRRRCTRRWRR